LVYIGIGSGNYRPITGLIGQLGGKKHDCQSNWQVGSGSVRLLVLVSVLADGLAAAFGFWQKTEELGVAAKASRLLLYLSEGVRQGEVAFKCSN